MPYVFGGSGGGGKSVLQTISFINSTTWSPAQDMNAKIYVIGGGGSGGGSTAVATGGGAGGCAVTIADLDASTTYTITVGAPGACVEQTSSGVNGNAGGNSSFAGSGITTLTGSGGQAGKYDTLANGAGAQTGGAGGAASGGTYGNFTGGAGGTVSGSGGYYKATGGGAVGLWATGTSAPAITGTNQNSTTGFYHNNGGYIMSMAGGASVGGTYLNFRIDSGDTTYSDLVRTTAGGFISLSGMGGGSHSENRVYEYNAGSETAQGSLPMGVGGPPIYNNGNVSITNIQAGAFAGGGATASATSSSYWALGSPGGIGGGGGGTLSMNASGAQWGITGQGGVGCVLIEVLEYK